jgi:hypothetical protein
MSFTNIYCVGSTLILLVTAEVIEIDEKCLVVCVCAPSASPSDSTLIICHYGCF